MGDEDARADPAEQCRDCIGDHLPVERPGVRRHLAEVLVQRFRVAGKEDARKEVRPDAEPEQVVPGTWSSGVAVRLTGRVLRPAPPRRGTSTRYTGNLRRKKMLWKPSLPSGVLPQHRENCPAPCTKTRGNLRGFSGIWYWTYA